MNIFGIHIHRWRMVSNSFKDVEVRTSCRQDGIYALFSKVVKDACLDCPAVRTRVWDQVWRALP